LEVGFFGEKLISRTMSFSLLIFCFFGLFCGWLNFPVK
jgi:hypothetical protein